MTPTTPMGTASRAMSKPFGRRQRASSRPTGSGRPATCSSPAAIPSRRASSSFSRSSMAPLIPRTLARSRSAALAWRMCPEAERIAAPASVNAWFFCAVALCTSLSAARRALRPISAITVSGFESVIAMRCVPVNQGYIVSSETGNRKPETVSSTIEQYQIVAVNHRAATGVAQDGLEFAAVPPDDLARLAGIVAGQSVTENAVAAAQLDQIAPAEVAPDLDHAAGQQAGAAGKRLGRAVVQHQRTGRVLQRAQPLLAPGQRPGRGMETGPDAGFEVVLNRSLVFAAGQQYRAAAGRGNARGRDLADHAAGAETGGLGAAGKRFDAGVDDRNVGHQPGPVAAPRIGIEQAVDIAEQHQQLCACQQRHARAQAVVVAEPDLAGRDGVVFVDDGHDAAIQQCLDGIARVEEPAAVFQVVEREQKLGGAAPAIGPGFGPGLGQPDLADRGSGLGFGQAGRPARDAERRAPQGDGAGRYDRH